MNYEDKINELENRLIKLEKVERRRKIKNIIVLSIYGIIVISIIVIIGVLYMKIKPYKEKIDNLKNFGSDLKTDSIIGDDNSFGFGGFGDFFSDFFNY